MNDASQPRLLHLALAAVRTLPVDALYGCGLWTEETLTAQVEDAQRKGELAVSGRSLRWLAGEDGELLATGRGEALAELLGHQPFPGLFLEAARSAAGERDHARARILYEAIASAPDRSLFPEGERGWLAAMVEATRLLRAMWGVSLATLDAAVALARDHGDRVAEALLLTARGMQSVFTDPARSRSFHERAMEAAEAHGDAALCTATRTYLAISLVMGGFVREGITEAERALGDLPEDLLDGPASALTSDEQPAPAWPIAALAWAHATTGHYPRALDILHRMAARGAELASPALEAQAHLYLGLVYAVAGDCEAARPHAETAQRHWSQPGKEAVYTWMAALGLAIVRGAQDRLGEAWSLLAAGLPAWRAAEHFSMDTSLAYELLERLERARLLPLPGYGLDSELARSLEGHNPQLAGIVHRLQAQRVVARVGPEARPEAERHLLLAIQKLRQSGGLRELHLALSDAADLADCMDRGEEALRLRREALDVARQIPGARLGGSTGALRLAPALLDLGKLGTLAPQREGLWGEIAARLCSDFGAERCALLLVSGQELSFLAARGAACWQALLASRLRAGQPAAPCFEPALGCLPAAGQLVLVPVVDEVLGRRGFVALENLHMPPVIGPGDEDLVAALGRQLGILLANVGMWRELLETRQRLEQENRYHRESGPGAALGVPRIAGASPAMRHVLGLVGRVAPTTTPVLITGETGVGKELVAREIHLRSPRHDGPLIAVHIASLAPGLAASALFGHERGAFTGASERRKGRFELADGGTIFLDEVGELSPEDQVRLLRVLQEGVFERVGGTRPIRSDFRLLAATNRDLAAAVQAGRFRSDLYFRLAAFPIRVPPLRERSEDVPELARHFLEAASRKLGVRFDGIDEADLARLASAPWPGNVRELAHVIDRAVLLSEPPRLCIPPLELGPAAPASASPVARAATESWPTLEELKRRYVRDVLLHAGGRVNGRGGAAEVLGVQPSTLQYWIDKLGLREELARARAARPPRKV